MTHEGQGRLYYRLGLSFRPDALEFAAADRGFTVVRDYRAIDDPADVRRDENGTWHIKAGARVGVTVSCYTPMDRNHVALIDRLPAGFETQNPDLAITAGDDEESRRSRRETCFEHQSLRDDRTEVFTSAMTADSHDYRYVVRAVTPGSFIAPPARIEELYNPETFGRTASDKVVIY